jgi:hypothetical protein
MQTLRSLLTLIAFLIAGVPALAQVSMGATTSTLQQIVTANQQGTGVTVPLTVGGNVVIKNDFGAGIVVRIRNKTTGELIAEVGINANSTWSGAHGLPAGTFNIFVEEASAPNSDDSPPAADTTVT